MVKEISKLTIKAFSISKVEITNYTSIKDHVLYINENVLNDIANNFTNYIEGIKLKIFPPQERYVYVNSIMDFIPISTKVLGKIGEGITHTLTGVCVMLTGADVNGLQVAEFGSSEGILNEHVIFDTPGTPSEDDIIINIDVTLKDGMNTVRKAITEVHKACDCIVQEIRNYMKKLNGRTCDDVHEYVYAYDSTKTNIAIIKQVAGQGAMYDTHVLPVEPCGVRGSYSIIDLGNLPVVLTPNEYRDGAIRAMY